MGRKEETMKVSKINYERLINTGDYSHEKYGMEIVLDEDEKAQEAFDKAKNLINKQIDIPSDSERRIAKKVAEFDEDIPF
jgi:hypothetical protein